MGECGEVIFNTGKTRAERSFFVAPVFQPPAETKHIRVVDETPRVAFSAPRASDFRSLPPEERKKVIGIARVLKPLVVGAVALVAVSCVLMGPQATFLGITSLATLFAAYVDYLIVTYALTKAGGAVLMGCVFVWLGLSGKKKSSSDQGF